MGKLHPGIVISKIKACLKAAKTTKDEPKKERITTKVEEALKELKKLDEDKS